jgi:hypothetical protein
MNQESPARGSGSRRTQVERQHHPWQHLRCPRRRCHRRPCRQSRREHHPCPCHPCRSRRLTTRGHPKQHHPKQHRPKQHHQCQPRPCRQSDRSSHNRQKRARALPGPHTQPQLSSSDASLAHPPTRRTFCRAYFSNWCLRPNTDQQGRSPLGPRAVQVFPPDRILRPHRTFSPCGSTGFCVRGSTGCAVMP